MTTEGMVYTIRRTNLGSPALYHYTVHRSDCPHAQRATRTYDDFDHIPGDLKIKIAVGTVSPCGHCKPDLSPFKERIHDLVGYEQRLHKMKYSQLLAEARRIDADIFKDITRPILIARILEAQHINPNLLAGDPPHA